MSNRRKNNHYHYAEKFEDKRGSSAKRAFVPFHSVIISLVVLLMFGLIGTTFSVYVSDNQPAEGTEYSPIISEVRNLKASRDIALTGANAELAETGATWSFSGGYLYYETTWTDKYICLVIGKNSYSSVYQMNRVTNTNYYVVSLPTSGWGDATYMAVIGTSSLWGSGSWGSSNLSNASHYTAAYTSGLSSSANQRYIFTGSTMEYKGTENKSMDTISLKAHACYTTDASTYTQDNDTGGTVKISSYYFNAYNSVATSDTGNGSGYASYDAAKTISTKNSTFTASAASGYRFEGWYNSLTGGSLVSSNASYSYSTNSGNKELYARFIKQVTVSVAKSPTSYSGSPAASPSSAVDVGTDVTLTADSRTGVTFNGWTTSSGASYTTTSGSASSTTWKIKPTSSFTATASYTLNKPTGLSLSYPSIVAGSTSTPTKSATSPAPGGTLNYLFTSITPASGTTAASGTYSVDQTTGVVSATTPGKYTVTMSVTTTAYGLTSAATTQTATVTVRPAAPTSIVSDADQYDSGEGTVAAPYKIPVNRTKFNIHSYIPIADRVEGYTYNWVRSDGRYTISSGAEVSGSSSHSVSTESTFEVTDRAADGSQSTDVIHNTTLQDTEGYVYKIAVTAVYNGVESDPYRATIYYGVTADFLVVESFDFSSFNSTKPVQKIYAEDNTIDHIDAVYDAGGTMFDTILKYSVDNINARTVAVWTDHNLSIGTGKFAGDYTALPDDSAHTVHDLIEEISVVARNSVNLMHTTGPKWFTAYVDDYNNTKIAAQYPELHTTVGTSSTVADRPIYYIDNTGKTFANSRVMAFYLVDGDTNHTVHYQTAQKVGSQTNTYRFYIPSDASKITFAHISTDNYVLPTYDATNGGLSYSIYTDHDVLMAWTSPIDLTASENAGKNAYKATAAGSPDGNGIYNYSGTLSNID